MNILVTYDVSTSDSDGPKRLRKVAKVCEDHGVRVQNSVFECTVDWAQLTEFRALLLAIIKPERDSLRFYRLGKGFEKKNIEHYGAKVPTDVQGALVV